MRLPAGLIDLLRRPSPCFLATVMPDGSPQMTQTWVDTDGTDILVNTVAGFQKVRNMERDQRVALNIADPSDVSRYYAVRGRVVSITPDGAAQHIEQLAQKYLGGHYPWFGGRDQQRLLVTIAAEKVTHRRADARQPGRARRTTPGRPGHRMLRPGSTSRRLGRRFHRIGREELGMSVRTCGRRRDGCAWPDRPANAR